MLMSQYPRNEVLVLTLAWNPLKSQPNIRVLQKLGEICGRYDDMHVMSTLVQVYLEVLGPIKSLYLKPYLIRSQTLRETVYNSVIYAALMILDGEKKNSSEGSDWTFVILFIIKTKPTVFGCYVGLYFTVRLHRTMSRMEDFIYSWVYPTPKVTLQSMRHEHTRKKHTSQEKKILQEYHLSSIVYHLKSEHCFIFQDGGLTRL